MSYLDLLNKLQLIHLHFDLIFFDLVIVIISKYENSRTAEGDKINFEPGFIQPDPTNDLLEEMKTFHISDISFTSYKKGA